MQVYDGAARPPIYGPTCPIACDNFNAAYYTPPPQGYKYAGSCKYFLGSTDYTWGCSLKYYCPYGGKLNGMICEDADCPYGKNETTGYCKCPYGKDASTGLCNPPPPPDPPPCESGSSGSFSWGSGCYVMPDGSYHCVNATGISSGCSSSGCTVSTSSNYQASCPIPASGQVVCTIQGVNTGETCTGTNGVTPPTQPCPVGFSIGSVNGQYGCYASGSDPSNPNNSLPGIKTNVGPDDLTSPNNPNNNTGVPNGSNNSDPSGPGGSGPTGTGGDKTTGSNCDPTIEDCSNANEPSGNCDPATQTCSEDAPPAVPDLPEVGNLYERGSRTVSDIFGEFTAKVQSAPFFTGASNFFTVNVPGGSCGGMTQTFSVMGQNFVVDADSVFCGSGAMLMYSLLHIGIMIGALWAAFRIAIL